MERGRVTPVAAQDHTNDRYVPRATGLGTQWGVFDRLEDRFVSDVELSTIPIERLAHEQLPTQ